jgi:glyoxylase-like metal-dependent hydrolase (beta-lactamase superfamily II)
MNYLPANIGSIRVGQLQEGEGALPMTMVLPGVATEDLRELRQWYWSEELSEDPAAANFKLAIRSYLLQLDDFNILIDTCNGNDKQRSIPFGHMLKSNYLEQLAAAGVSPDEIHLVLCTHLHADHVGWNTRLDNGRWVPTFPNARYVFSRRDYEFFSRQTHEAFHREAYLDSVLPIVEAGRADIVESDHIVTREIGDGVWLEDAAGHSPGCCIVNARRGGSQVAFTGDVFHHPIQLVRPDLAFFADEDAGLAATARRRVMKQYVDSGTVLCPAHFCGEPWGRIRSTERPERYRFEPAG